MMAVSLILLIFFAGGLMWSSQAELRRADQATGTIVVPSDFLTIQSAIDSAAPGDSIYVKAGVYDEHLLINKSLSLIGQDNATTVIEGPQEEDTITVLTDNVTISGFTLRKWGNPATPVSWVIRLLNTHNTTISHNVITGNFEGVGIAGGSSNFVQHNLIAGNRYGIFTSNFTSNNAPQIFSWDNVIFDNVVSDSVWNGIELDWGGGNTIYENTIINNTAYGLEIPAYTPSLNNIVFHNNIVGNARTWEVGKLNFQAYGPLPNLWDYYGEGNYWSDYKGRDEDQDGIGDTPMTTMYGTTDNYPLMGNFSSIGISTSHLTVVSNSAIMNSSFRVNGSQATISMSVIQEANLTGFCRITIPQTLITDPYEVRLDGEVNTLQARELPCSNGTYECLYFEYDSGRHLIEITGTETVSEYSLPMLFALIGTATLGTFAARSARALMKKHRGHKES
jgi:parallel beta-helix repeat protein